MSLILKNLEEIKVTLNALSDSLICVNERLTALELGNRSDAVVTSDIRASLRLPKSFITEMEDLENEISGNVALKTDLVNFAS